jgi:hypothetical protein
MRRQASEGNSKCVVQMATVVGMGHPELISSSSFLMVTYPQYDSQYGPEV